MKSTSLIPIMTFAWSLNRRQLIFGLRAAGVGVLNLANVARFAIHPEFINGSADARGAKRRIPVYQRQECARQVPITVRTKISRRVRFGQE